MSCTSRQHGVFGSHQRKAKARKLSRRGVVAILAMMFLVLFTSLGVAMAIASKGNLRTASTQSHVNRAVGAAETGLAIAESRLAEAASRFVISRGSISGTLGARLWDGTAGTADTAIDRMPPKGYTEPGLPSGIAQALVNMHNADRNKINLTGAVTNAAITSAPSGSSSAYRTTSWVVTPVIGIDSDTDVASNRPSAFQVTYAPLANGTDIRIIVTGYSSVSASGTTYAYGDDGNSQAAAIKRVIYRDFRMSKRHQHALVSPVRVLVGSNVQVDGSIGVSFTDTDKPKGDPLVIRSDFWGLNARLDQKLIDLFKGIEDYDVDGDNRLRVAHPVESLGVPPASRDYDGNGAGDNAFQDVTSDGFIDDFDTFLRHYDTNNDGRVVLSAALTAGTPASALTAEFTANDDLALMIDSGVPDRNVNGAMGWQDTNRNGRWDVGENLNDYDAVTGTYPDRVLGWRDGVIDRRDQYAKVRGRLLLRTTRAAWETGQSHDYQRDVQGAIRQGRDQSATEFGVGVDQVPNVSIGEVTSATAGLKALADGASFAQQVAAQLGIGLGQLSTYTETDADSTQPRFFRGNMNNAAAKALTGQNLYERMPFNSPNFTDWYVRPRYENMVFRNVEIPRGTNALFVNCTFVGATFVRTHVDNTHPNWSLYGRMSLDTTTGMPAFNTAPLDKSDFLRYTTNNPTDGPANYADFPDPPIIDGVVRLGDARNTKLYSNNIRFHNCLFVGSIVSDTPLVFNPIRQKLQFTGSTRFTQTHPTAPNDLSLNPDSSDLPELAKSSMMLPQYSVEVGQFNSPTDTFAGGPTPQNVSLRGTIIAGVLDARGNTDIEGTLMMTFRPVLGEPPLVQYGQATGNPANFNVSLGYLGADDGDSESLDPRTLPEIAGQKIAGWDTDGDGLPDVGPAEPQPPGSTAVPFYGLGRVRVAWNPSLPMPDGIRLPISIVPIARSYGEGMP